MSWNSWEKIWGKKLEWAYRGKKKFINSLHLDEFKDLYKMDNGRANVAVFGNSQVGKTTLIMKLMGVKNNCDLHYLLRGNQTQGKCVTATTMLYLRSENEDDYFYYKEYNQPEEKITGEQLRNKLSLLREKVEMGDFQIPEISKGVGVVIRIPQNYFDDNVQALNINIIDLPGINSGNLAELKYVDELIKRVVPLLDIILLVESSDHFTPLEKIGIPEIDCFRDLPERFRLILTKTYSLVTEKEWITDNDKVTKDLVIQRWRGDDALGTLKNFSIPKELKIYPIEFGDSWVRLKKDHQQLYQKVDIINEQFIADLRSDINNSITEYNRLMQMVKYKEAIKKRMDSIHEQLSNKKKRLKTAKDVLEGKKSLMEEKCNSINIKVESTSEEIRTLDIEKFNFEPYRLIAFNKPSYLASELRRRINQICCAVTQYLDENQFNKENRDKIVVDVRNMFRYKIKDLISDLDRRKDFYSPIFSRKEDDAAHAKLLSDAATKKILEYIEIERKKKIEEKRKNLFDEVKKLNDEEVIINNNITKIRDRILNFDYQISEIEKKITEFNLKAEEDLQNSKRFFEFIKSEFYKEKKATIHLINLSSSEDEKMLWLFYAGLITREMKKLEGQVI